LLAPITFGRADYRNVSRLIPFTSHPFRIVKTSLKNKLSEDSGKLSLPLSEGDGEGTTPATEIVKPTIQADESPATLNRVYGAEPTASPITLDELVHDNGDSHYESSNTWLGDSQEFFLPVHGFVHFTPSEIRIIDHPAFQRLAKIYQLGQSFLVYRGATHKRIEHCLGTLHVAQQMIDAVHTNYRQFKTKATAEHTRCQFDEPVTKVETRFIRLAALLHDIGHISAGHTLEDELGLLDEHDADRRLNLVFNKTDWVKGVKSQALGDLIDELYREFLPAGGKVSPREVVRQIISKDANSSGLVEGIRVGVCKDIVGNTICADLLDYLHRDWHHIGKPKFFEKRLFQYMQIRRDALNNAPQFVITYGFRNRPKRDAISAILELLESRYALAEAVLFHPTKCAAAAMLERGIGELYRSMPDGEGKVWLGNLENRLLHFSDDELISELLQECIKSQCAAGTAVFQSLALRNTYKSVVVVTREELEPVTFELLLDRFVGTEGAGDRMKKQQIKRAAASRRGDALRMFEQDFKLPTGTVVLYCPPPRMNSKIAEVKIIRRDSIKTLENWDKDSKLAGGHCEAQLRRFNHLWRAEVFLRESEMNRMNDDQLTLFRKAVGVLLLGVTDDGLLPERQATSLAELLAAQGGSPFSGQAVISLLAARDGRNSYPMGAPSLRSLFGME
jgi:HD superfamily phosphohydrolase